MIILNNISKPLFLLLLFPFTFLSLYSCSLFSSSTVVGKG
jgi:hypothetical protein